MSKALISVTVVTNKCIKRLWETDIGIVDYSLATTFRSTCIDIILYRKYGTVPYTFLFTLIHMFQRIMGFVRPLYGLVPQYNTLPYGTVISTISRQQSISFLWIWNEATLALSSIWGHKYLVMMCLALDSFYTTVNCVTFVTVTCNIS